MSYGSNRKIDGLTSATSLAEGNVIPVSQSGSTLKATLELLRAFIFGPLDTHPTVPGDGSTVVVRRTDNELRQVTVDSLVPAGSVNNAKVAADAAIAHSKLATLGSGQILVGSSGSVPTPRAVTGDAALTDLGVLSLNNGAVATAKIADAAVTSPKLAPAVQALLVPTGAVMAFAMPSAPTGWAECNGAAVSRTNPTYATLFSQINVIYGAGDGVNTFNLPDLRGYFVRGYGTNSDGTVSSNPLFFGSKQPDDLKSHLHFWGMQILTSFASGGVGAYWPVSNANNLATTSTGGSETRPKNISMLYCIKL
jgi:hypothetical protein